MSEPDEMRQVWLAVEAAMLAIEGEVTYESLTDAVLATPVLADAFRDAKTLAKVRAIVARPRFSARLNADKVACFDAIADLLAGES